jgi:phenylacetate-CoA ligase
MSYIDRTIGAYLRRNILLTLYWKYIKHLKVLDYYKELQAHQWNTLKKNRNLQRIKLFKLIQYASQNIPYYQRVIQEHQISFSEDTIFTDLKKFPLLTKEIIRNHFDQLYKFRDRTYYRNTSGGSTGELVIFYQDSNYFAWSTAAKIFFDEWAGRKIGEPTVKLWGSLRDVLRGGQGFTGYLRQQLSGVTILISSRMTDQDKYQYVKRINQIKPCLILAFPNSIDELARFIKEHHLAVYSPLTIMTSGSVLFPEVRARIKEVFHSIIFDRYGSREVGDIACNCAKSEGLHLVPDIHYLEIVDDKGEEVKQEEAGNIIVTLLTNYTMPLIRYKIGDMGILSERNCQCGRESPLLEKVVGRINSRFKNKFGDYINTWFNSLFYFQDNIKQYQVIQETTDLILINLVLINKDKLKDMDKFFEENNQKICKIMGHQITVKYNIVDEIQPSPSGKYMYTFSKVGGYINT